MKEKISNLLEMIGTFLLIVMSTLVFIQVLSRFIFEIPVPWIEELSKLMLIWLTYFLLAPTFLRNYHVRIDLIDEFVSKKVSYMLNILINILGIVLTVVTLRFILYFFETQMTFGQSTPVMMIPMYVVIIPLLVGTGITILYFISEVFSGLKGIRQKRWESEK